MQLTFGAIAAVAVLSLATVLARVQAVTDPGNERTKAPPSGAYSVSIVLLHLAGMSGHD